MMLMMMMMMMIMMMVMLVMAFTHNNVDNSNTAQQNSTL